MSDPRSVPTGWVTGFRGENRVLPDHALPPNIAPSALNIDYADGTLKKRPGLRRRHLECLTTGGVLLGDARNGDRYIRLTRTSGLNFGASDAFEYEFTFLFDEKVTPDSSIAGAEFDLINDLTSNTGIKVVMRWNGTAWRLRLYIGQSTPGTDTLDHTTDLEANTVYDVRMQRGTGTGDFGLNVNGVTVTGNYTSGTFVYNSGTYLIMGSDSYDWSPAGLRVVIDDFRVWATLNRSPILDSLYNIKRTLRPEEITEYVDDGNLLGLWRFDSRETNRSFASNAGTLTGAFASVESNDGLVQLSRGLVLGTAKATVTGLSPVYNSDGVESSLLVCTENAIYLLDYATDSIASVHLLDQPSLTRWSFAQHTSYILLSNGESRNLRYSIAGGVRSLSLDAPSSGFTLTVSATGGSFGGAGVVKYLFAYYDSVTGQESYPLNAEKTATLAAGTDKVTISNLPLTDQPGVTSIRIYRTEVGGSTYYRLKTIPYGVGTTYVDTNSGTAGDGTVDLTAPWYKFKGYAEPSLFLLEHNGNVLACNQDGYTTRIRFSEPGTAGDFYFNNFFFAGVGDGDELTGGIVVSGVPVLFKRNSVWVVLGSGPSSYTARKVYDGVGCVHHATIGASQAGVYFQSNDGVYLMPLPVQSGPPVDITENSQRSLFGGLRDDQRRNTFGIFDNVNQRYFTSLTLNGERRVLVYDQRTQAWALWTLEADSFCIARPEGAEPEVIVGFRGYAATLDDNYQNDGSSTTTTTGFDAGVFTVGNSITPDQIDINGVTTTIPATAGGPFQNLGLLLKYPNGTSEWATALYSNDNNIFLQSAVTGVGSPPIPTGTVIHVQPIECSWTTGLQSYDGMIDDEKKWERIRFLFQPGGNATLTATVTGEDRVTESAVTQTFTLDTSRRIERKQLNMRGDEIKVAFTESSANKKFTMAGFQPSYQQREPRP